MRNIALLCMLSLAACATGERLTAPKCPDASEAVANVPGLAPVVWDNQYSTFLRFPGHQAIPSITALGQDGKERTVNTSPNNESGLVMIHGVYPTIMLRDASRVACVHNRAFDHVGRAYDEGAME